MIGATILATHRAQHPSTIGPSCDRQRENATGATQGRDDMTPGDSLHRPQCLILLIVLLGCLVSPTRAAAQIKINISGSFTYSINYYTEFFPLCSNYPQPSTNLIQFSGTLTNPDYSSWAELQSEIQSNVTVITSSFGGTITETFPDFDVSANTCSYTQVTQQVSPTGGLYIWCGSGEGCVVILAGFVAYEAPIFQPYPFVYAALPYDNIGFPASGLTGTAGLTTLDQGLTLTWFPGGAGIVSGTLTVRAAGLDVIVAKQLGDGSSPGKCSCGDPIDVGSGNVYETVSDYRTAGSNQLSFTRYYNSLAGSATFVIALGNNWRSTYDRYLNITSSGGVPTAVSAERANGQVLTFTENGGNWISDSDVDLQLTQTGASTWTLTDHDDTIETYNVNPSGEGVVTSIQARNGYTQTLQYNSSNQLTSVTDSYNRTLSFAYSGGLLSTVTTPDGLVLTYTYTAAGGGNQLTSVSYSTSPVTSQTYLYENTGLPFGLTGITDEDGTRFATWTYDALGRGLTSQHAGGAGLTTVSYDDTTGNRTVTNALGEQLLYKFTALQNVPKVSEIDRQATSTTAAATETFTYDSNGYTASQIDWNGNLTTYVNNAHGQPTSITEASGTPQARVTTIAYDPTFVHLPDQISTPGLTANFTYDPSGNVLTKTLTDTTNTTAPYSTNGQNRTWTWTWSNFLPASSLAPRTGVSELTQFTYDSSGALIATTNALGQVTKITQRTPGGLPRTIVDPNGVTTNLTYDARLRLLTSTLTTSAGPLTTSYAYDAAGNLLKVTQPDGSAFTNTYDAAHRLIGTADLFTNGIAYTLDANGDRINTAVSNPGGTVTRRHSATFDALGRLLNDIGGVGQTTAYGYDGNGNALTITDPLQRVTQQSFDALNRVAQLVNPAQGNASFSYDPHDRPVSVTDPNGNTTTYTYDGFGDLIQEVSPARGTTVYSYDPDGNLTQKIDARGAIANYIYDALDRVTSTTYPADAAENVTYTYDQAAGGFGIGRLTSVADAVGTLSRTYDERGDVLTELRGSGASAVKLLTKYAYDGAGRIVSITYPSGTAVVYARDSMGRITGVTAQPLGAANPTTVVSGIAYQPFGPPNALTFGNTVAELRSFDLDYRLTALADAGNNPVQGLTYGYNAANDVLSIADAVTPANSQSLGYDVLDRLTGAGGGYGALAWSYDANGNRLTESPAAPTLDGLGSVTGLAYNQAGRLAGTTAGAQQITQYTYDAFGQRLAKVGAATAMTFFQYDRGGHLLEETDNLGNLKADYIYLDGRPIAEFNAGQLYFLHDDRLGTPQVATNSAQATVWVGNYEPFGALTASSGTALLGQDLRLPGQENDLETGLYHNGFRDYVPGWGRYSQSDPSGFGGKDFNLYRYATDNPVRFVDPLGLNNRYLSGSTGSAGGPPSTGDIGWQPSDFIWPTESQLCGIAASEACLFVAPEFAVECGILSLPVCQSLTGDSLGINNLQEVCSVGTAVIPGAGGSIAGAGGSIAGAACGFFPDTPFNNPLPIPPAGPSCSNAPSLPNAPPLSFAPPITPYFPTGPTIGIGP
jgi:RHS repeat-associated protein